MATDDDESLSRYLTHLPAVLRERPDDDPDAPSALARVVLALERVLGGLDAPLSQDPLPGTPAVGQLLARLATYLTPLAPPGAAAGDRAPEHFLPWLADWVALTLRDDWDTAARRRLIGHAVRLYRTRGTRRGLIDALELLLGESGGVAVYEFTAPPHFFQVEISQRQRDLVRLARLDRMCRALIDRFKPAHTFFGLRIGFPSMQIVDTPASPDEGVIVGTDMSTLGSTTFKP